MNTPAHLIFGLAAFSKRGARGGSLGAAAGAIAPDLSLYLLVGWALGIAKIPPGVVFGEMYFSDTWRTVFAIDNSVFVWGAVLATGLWARAPVMIAFGAAALLHIALDLPLHHDDGRPYFWPLTMWVYESLFSYWDQTHGARWIAPLETAVVLGLAVLLWRRHRHWVARAGVMALRQCSFGRLFCRIDHDPHSRPQPVAAHAFRDLRLARGQYLGLSDLRF
jgi:hypothetical protein